MTNAPTHRAGKPPVLLIDAGGVLLLNNHELLLPLLEEYSDLRTPEDYQRVHFACHNSTFSGVRPDGDYYRRFGEVAGVADEELEEFTEAFRALSHTRNMCHLAHPPARRLLGLVRAAGIATVVVSQADGTAAQLLREAEMCQIGEGPGVEVDGIVDSELVGFDKPDPEIFRCALDLVGASPEQAVHLGDTVPADVRGAQAAGIRAVHYDPFDDCEDLADDHEHVRRLEQTYDLLLQHQQAH